MKDLREREIGFQGRITAGFTHEIKNVLAIIKENSGLMEDILSMLPQGSFPAAERLLRAIGSIRQQTERGVELSNQLNRFAHMADHPKLRVDLNRIVEQIVILSRRFARLKDVSLEAVVSADQPVSVEMDPVGLQLALFTGMECCWNALPPGSGLTLTVTKRGSDGIVCFSCQGGLESQAGLMDKIVQSEEWNSLLEIMRDTGGGVETGQLEHSFLLKVPQQE
ncbi:MAG: hypothetical protein ACLGPL_09345 [Acidobacteriota bacterium]